MALKVFEVKLDVAEVESLATAIGAVSEDQLSQVIVDATNQAAHAAYDLSVRHITKAVNLSESYIERRMALREATKGRPTAEITAFGDSSLLTNLGHYGSSQQSKAVRWTNDWIAQNIGKFEGWPGWTRRTGAPHAGIDEDEKAAGLKVGVKRSGAKKLAPGLFTLPGVVSPTDGTQLLFANTGRITPKSGKKRGVRAVQGPSVYQLFRTAATDLNEEIADDLEAKLVAMAEAAIAKAITS